MRYISRSSHEAFRQCLRAGYYRYLAGPYGPATGLEPSIMAKQLALGIAWHKGGEVLMRRGSGTEAAASALAEAEKYPAIGQTEKQWLLAACLAWERTRFEEFHSQYDVIAVEEEVEVAISPNVILQARADAVVQDRNDGSYWVWNWKTASDIKDWNKKWFFDVQTWTETLAMEGHLGVPVAGCIFEGVYKGPIWNGNMTSRLVLGYKKSTADGSVSYSTDRETGMTRFNVWEESFPFGDGVAAWISWLPYDFVRGHFALSAPQMRNDVIVTKWLRQLVRVETDIDHLLSTGSAEDVEDYFIQNFDDHCGKCPYVDLCQMRSTPEALIEEGKLIPRRDHHAVTEEGSNK
jgi:hypothetical protein